VRTLFWWRIPFLLAFLALTAWFAYAIFFRNGKNKWL
jgi:hypothetical protein